MTLLALFIGGCGKSVPRDEQERNKPGYKEVKAYCSQCHALPFADQHPPAGWPDVVARMAGYMRAANRKMPNQAEYDAIIGYFQSN